MKYNHYQEFKADLDALNAQLETYRSKCKTRFFVHVAIGIAVIASLPIYAHTLTEAVNHLFVTAASKLDSSWKLHASKDDDISVTIFIIAMTLWFMVWPIFSYRGKDSAGGTIARAYSFQDRVYSKLLALFGKFSFATSGGVLSALTEASILPKYKIYEAEDYISGIMNDYTVKIAEARIARIRRNNRSVVFKGIVIAIDVSEINVKLRGTFAGKTVLIADGQKTLRGTEEKYKNFQRVALENAAFESEFEAFSTQPAEARNLLTTTFITRLVELQHLIQNSTEQRQHFDDKIAYAVKACVDKIKWPFARRSLQQIAYENAYEASLDLTKDDAFSSDADAINKAVQAEFFDDKLVITIPTTHDLFETNSLFEPALHEEDAKLLFAMMQTINGITKDLNQFFSTRS